MVNWRVKVSDMSRLGGVLAWNVKAFGRYMGRASDMEERRWSGVGVKGSPGSLVAN